MDEKTLEKREHYFGLSLEECQKLYEKKWETFRREWRNPLSEMLREFIGKRVKSLDGQTEEEIRKYHSDAWMVNLPFYLPLEDDFGEQQFWGFLEVPIGRYIPVIRLSRIDRKTEETITKEVSDIDELQFLMTQLDKMGFWDDSRKEMFYM